MSCLASLACCLCPSPCGCCCGCCPTSKSSTTSRLMYGVMLLVGTVVSALFLTTKVANAVLKSNTICSTIRKVVKLDASKSCVDSDDLQKYFSNFAVYRIFFALACFYLLFMVIMYAVKTSHDPRAKLQNGFWLFKYLALIAITVGAFYIQAGSFETALYGIAITAAWFFIVVQLVLLIDFAHSWNESWVGKMEESDGNGWKCALLFFTFGMFAAAFAIFVVLLVFFTQSGGCSLNKFFIAFTFLAALVVTIISILPKIQDATPTSGLLQSAVVFLYVMYITWSAVSSEPYGPTQNCNVDYQGTNPNGTHAAYSGNNTTSSIVGIVMAFALVMYACVFTASKSQLNKLKGKDGDAERTVLCNSSNESGDDDQRVYDNEQEAVAYSYSFFHFMCMLAALYLMLLITGWTNPQDSLSSDIGKSFTQNWPSVWVKMTSAWVCLLIYLWTLLAPVVLPDREFH
ncbi:probable serine incorporator [Sycon ciliatum]|uniref:probable serine incorporator n=1 Tax=Sycon ciliatum TaxID=27933 RepID=UPI0020AB1D6C|eukprot:scpid49433/ scgid33007/ Serine incorporator 3